MERIIRGINGSGYKITKLNNAVSLTWQKIKEALDFWEVSDKLNRQKNKVGFLVWLTLAGTWEIKANHCQFESTHWFSDAKKWSLSKVVWGLDNWNDIEKVYVQKWWKTIKVPKKKLRINESDKIKVTDSKQLCVTGVVDYNFKEFSEEGLLDYVKDLSEKYNIDYRYVLSVMHQESKFETNAKSETWAKGFGQLTKIAIVEINRVYKKTHTVADVKWNQMLNIEYSVIYLALMFKRHWSIKEWIKYYNWDKKHMHKYVKIVMRNYNKIYKKMES